MPVNHTSQVASLRKLHPTKTAAEAEREVVHSFLTYSLTCDLFVFHLLLTNLVTAVACAATC